MQLVTCRTVIDAVGYLRMSHTSSSKKVTLVFVQVSISKYSRHETKKEDLYTCKAPEDPTKHIINYFTELIPPGFKCVGTVYVYISPHAHSKNQKFSGEVQYADKYISVN